MKETRSLSFTRRDYYDVYSRHPVMTPEMIRQLPAGHALIIRGGHSPVIARLRMGWKDRRYRSARSAGVQTVNPTMRKMVLRDQALGRQTKRDDPPP